MNRVFSFITVLLGVYFAASCGNKGNGSAGDLPKPGTLIDSVSEPVLEDKLNNFRYSVKVLADSDIKEGVYAIKAEFEDYAADGKFTMPKGVQHYTIKLKKDVAPYTYLIGFYLPKDTAFYKYLEVKAVKGAISMLYVKSYSFE